MKTSQLRVGIIGCGGIANGKHMPALAKLKTVAQVAFCDIVQERADEAAAKYGVKGATVYTDYQKMLAAEQLDVVHVCTANNTHAPITVAALESGAHVMSEKPMAKNADGARAMLAAHQKTGKKLSVGYQNRYRPDAQYLKKVCDAGGLGEIYYARALAIRRRAVPTWGVFMDKEAQGGGPLVDIGTHALDLTLWMMNNYEPEYVVGTSYHKLGKKKNAANAWGPWDPKKYTVEDSAFGFIRFKNGATVVLESSWAINMVHAREARCILCGTEAGADMDDGLRINGERFSRLYVEKAEMQTGGVDFYDGASDNPSDIEARLWIEAILKDKDPVVKPEQALMVTEILEAIYVSAETAKPVFFDSKLPVGAK
jgi:predicted dehydrogenase